MTSRDDRPRTSSAEADPAGATGIRRRTLLERSLSTRFGLRVHMSLMLTAAFAVGFGANFIMLRAGFHALVLRWIVAYVIGYAVLFVAMRCWLAYVGVRPFGSPGRALDGGDVGWSSSSGGSGGSGGGGFSGGGGRFGGAGASADFGEASAANARFAAVGANASSSSSSSGGLDFSFGDVLDGDGVKLAILLAVIVAIIAAFGGGIVFMIANAPHLLVDVAFGAAITSGVAPAARRAALVPAWHDSVFRATWKPVLVMLVVLVACAVALAYFFPGASTLGGAWSMAHAKGP